METEAPSASGKQQACDLALALAEGRGAWHGTTDVIVVGAGLAGYCAALEAAAGGAHVLLLEKEAQVGGSSILSGGAMAFAGTDEQRERGIEDDSARLYDDLRRVGAYENDEGLLRIYVEQQLETYRWLKSRGAQFGSVELGGGQSIPRSNRVRPPQMLSALVVEAEGSGRIRLLPETAVERLVHNGARVAGVVCRSGAVLRALAADRGVVLTAGGFSRSETMLRTFAPLQAKAQRIGGPGNTGDVLRMAWALGADLRDMGHIKGTFGSHPQAGALENALVHAIYRGAIAVNRNGRRFVDESLSYKLLGDACLQQPGAVSWQIFDAPIMAQSVDGVVSSDFRGAQRLGRVVEAATLEALGATIGIDGATLAATVADYNANVASGRDPVYGRDGLANHYGRMVPIATPPFYAYASTSALLATYCGLAVDGKTRVLNVFGEPIAGLYAAGEITGGFHGVAYMTGSSLGKSAVFGRIAGRQAARGPG